MKRKRRKWFALVLALASGGAAGYLALNHLQRPPAMTAASDTGTTQVAVAARSLEIGTVLSPADVKMVNWPASAVPPGYAVSMEAVVGRGVITTVAANEPLLAQKMSTPEEGGGLSIVIPEGMRAVSVKVDEVISVAGFVVPGTRVDVLVTLSATSDADDTATRVILQNVQVLAAGQTIQRDAEGTPQTVTVITLLVTPEQAEELTLAATEGRIQLALRNLLDTDSIPTTGVNAANLVRGAGAQSLAPSRPVSRGPRRAARPSGSTIVTYNGADRTETSF